jgi:hypothetical protein
MRPLTVSPENQQRLAIAVPIIALLLSLFVVYPTWGRYTALLETAKQNRTELAKLRAEVIPDVGKNLPAAADLPSEPPDFYRQLQLVAGISQCRIMNFDLGGTGKQEDGPVRAVRAHVELEARYNEVRAFLANLAAAPRLYVVTECSVATQIKSGTSSPVRTAAKDPSLLRATIEIERYVNKPSGT